MQAPYSRFPAVPAAIGLLCGILSGAGAGAWLWAAIAAGTAAGVALWLRRDTRYFAAAPLALAAGIMLSARAEAPEKGNPLSDVREGLTERVYTSPLDGDAAAFTATTLTADGRYMRRALRDDFRNSGMAHVLALSGFHAGVIAMLAMLLTRPMLLCRRLRAWRPVPVVAAVWAFVLVGGAAASLQRAAVMLTMLLLARMTGRSYSSVNALAVAAIAILLARPSAATDAGFALSFAAVAGIVLLTPVLNPFDAAAHPWLHRLAGLAAVPAAATLATAPIVAAVFGSLPLLFLPANVVLSLVFAPFYVLALAVTLLSAAGMACAPLTAAADGLFDLMVRTAGACSSAVAVDMHPAGIAAFYAALLALGLVSKRTRSKDT